LISLNSRFFADLQGDDMLSDRVLGLTPSQRGMVFRQLVGPPGGVDVAQVVMAVDEPVDAGRLLAAWRAVIARHPVLHSKVVETTTGEHGLLPQPDFQPEFTRVNVHARESEAAFEHWLAEDRMRGFDLFAQVPLRFALLRTQGGAERCVCTFHEILLDDRALLEVLTDVWGAYDALGRGQAPLVPARPDTSAFLKELRERDTAPSLAYWRTLLANVEPTPFPGTEVAATSLQAVERSLDERQSEAIERWIGEAGVSFDGLIQAAWASLLARHVDQDVVVFGRQDSDRGSGENAGCMLGMFDTTVPVRAEVGRCSGIDLVRALCRQQEESRAHLQVPLAQMNGAGHAAADALFQTVVACDEEDLDAALQRLHPAWHGRRFVVHRQLPFPAVLQAYRRPGVSLRLAWMDGALTPAQAARILEHLQALLRGIVAEPTRETRRLPMLTDEELGLIAGEWNATDLLIAPDTIHGAFARAVAAHPQRAALTGAGRVLSYAELDAASDAVAATLVKHGVRRGALVGLSIDRSLELVIAMLGILKAGAAYLPLDPDYPSERLDFCMRDSRAQYVVTQRSYAHRFPAGIDVIAVEEAQAHTPATWWHETSSSGDLAYVIYTSGSTGKPKGVKVTHGNVANFFAGMDAHIDMGTETERRWLAVTSPSFDISVLELLWTLTRDFEVIVHGARELGIESGRPWPSFSLFHFASGMDGSDPQPYRLILEAAKFADSHRFEAIWSPERHFHDFGAPYPNPSVMNAALATITRRVQLRAGSCVLPLHDPLRVAEEWALVDQLSGGRVGISFASGWQPNDFVLAPDNYERRKDLMFEQIEAVRALWRGERIKAKNPKGDEVLLGTYPRPVQAELPVWVTAAGSPDTFRQAGAIGANILTHMLGQSLGDLDANIRVYREARAGAGLDPATGRVTVMVHTFIGEDTDVVREQVREPMQRYLRSAASLVGNYADAWAAFKRGAGTTVAATAVSQLSAEEQEELYAFAFERYFESSGLLGSVEKCAGLVESLRNLSVDEIACLIDFGVEQDTVIEHLPYIDRLRTYVVKVEDAIDSDLEHDLAAHAITHLQCTPSLASTIPMSTDGNAALSSLRQLLVGGEALPRDLVAALYARLPVGAGIINMYGPTETTIWSTVEPVEQEAQRITIGRPIANTQCYVLDAHRQLVPPGCVGELHIGGHGVTPGYHERPELNAERFFDLDVSGRVRRVYATGDLVRQLDDGRIEYLGRNDFQVKVRGHRVELGEIEVALRTRPGVTNAVVVACNLSPGNQVLVGYLVGARDSAGSDVESLKSALRTRLPEYMVPATFVWLDALPHTPNGKIDRRALPLPIPHEQRELPQTPASDTERVIREIWQRVLNVGDIGRQDNFFELGGHSILAMKVQSELAQAFGYRLPLVELFRSPTIEALAAHFTRHGASGAGAPAAAGIEKTNRRRVAMNLRANPTVGRNHEGQ